MSNNAILSDEDVINDPPVFLSTKTPKKIRRKFDLEFKVEVVRWYEENGKNQCLCELHFGVNRQTIAGWLGQSEAIQTSKYKRKRYTVVTRKAENENAITQPLRENLNPHLFLQSLIPSLITS